MLGWLLGFLWMIALRASLMAHPGLDADTLVVADLWKDLWAGGRLGDWTMCPHPYVFPDLALYGIGSWFSGDIVGRQTAYGLVLGFLLWCFLARLMKRLWRLKGGQARAYAAAGLLLVLPFVNEGNGLMAVFLPGDHGGALLCSLAWLAWALKQELRPSSIAAVLWSGFLLGITWASDQIIPAGALLPGLLLSLGLGPQAVRRIFASAGVAALVRWIVLAYWKLQGMQVAHYEWGYFWAHAASNLDSMASLLFPFLAVAWVPMALGLGTLGFLFQSTATDGLNRWMGLAMLGLFLSALALGIMEGSMQGRYFLGFVWLCVPCLPLLISRQFQGPPLPLLACSLLGLMWLGYFQPSPSPAPALRQARWLDSNLASRGISQGFADYWHARPLRLLSGRGLALTPVISLGKGLVFYTWSADRRQFEQGRRPSFVVLNGLDPEQVRAKLGAPSGLMLGEGLRVWLY